jgi:hypothetical protein
MGRIRMERGGSMVIITTIKETVYTNLHRERRLHVITRKIKGTV